MLRAMGEIQPVCEVVPCSSPQPTLTGKEVKAGGKGQLPVRPPHGPLLCELGGLGDCWLVVMAGS